MADHDIGGKYRENPAGPDKRGKARSQRKHREDGPTLTPTESRTKDRLMNQFRRTGEGPGAPSAEFRANYDRAFGRHAGAAVDAVACDSLTCWCRDSR